MKRIGHRTLWIASACIALYMGLYLARRAPSGRAIEAPGDGELAGTIAHAERRAPGNVNGVVTGPDGKPVGDAQVCATCTASARSACLTADLRSPRCVSTGADGLYRLLALPAGEYSLSATKPQVGHAARTEPLTLQAGQTATVDIALDPRLAVVRGRATDLLGGPVVATIVGTYTGADRHGLAGVVESGADGRFEAWVQPSRSIRWAARAEGYADGAVTRPAPSDGVEIALAPAARISGRVVMRGDGRPVAGAEVRAADGMRPLDMPWDVHTFSDAEGNFALDRLKPGRYFLSAVSPRGRARLIEPVAVGLTEARNQIILALDPGASVSGRAVLADGSGCTNAKLALTGAPPLPPERHVAMSDGEGRLRLEGLPFGSYAVEVSCWGHARESGPERLLVLEAGAADLLWTFARGLQLTVVVRDASSEPVAGVGVLVRTEQGQPEAAAYFMERTDATGSYVFGGLAAGDYVVELQGQPDAPPRQVALERHESVEIRLPSDGRARVKVTSEDGTPIDGLTVVVRAQSDPTQAAAGPAPQAAPAAPPAIAAWLGHQTRALGGGLYETDPIPPGDYSVTALDARLPKVTAKELLRVARAAVAHAALVIPTHSGVLKGQVVDDHGEALPAVWVGVSYAPADADPAQLLAARAPSESEQHVLTDATGHFQIERLALGEPYDLRAQLFDTGQESITKGVRAGDTVRITLPALGAIRGVVLDSSGRPLQRYHLAAKSQVSGVPRFVSIEGDSGGRFAIDGIVPGPVELEAASEAGRAHATIVLAAGQTLNGISLRLAQPEPTP